MAERFDQIDHFLAANGWSDASLTLLAGDASGRRYFRLCRGTKSAVVMDSEHEEIGPFCRAAKRLAGLGLSSPKIFAEDALNRLLLLEDFGDFTFSHCLDSDTGLDERMLYGAASDLLAMLGQAPVGDSFPVMDRAYLVNEIRLFAEWWPPEDDINLIAEEESWVAAWHEAHALALEVPTCLSLRDFHAANLMWLAERDGIARVGLLDFQDAVIAPLPYDLVSMLQDVRRDLPDGLEDDVVARFLSAFPSLDTEAFHATYAILGAHRNLRIAGVFSRLARRDGKYSYLEFLPRVWRYIDVDLVHPALAPVRAWLAHYLPPGQERRAP